MLIGGSSKSIYKWWPNHAYLHSEQSYPHSHVGPPSPNAGDCAWGHGHYDPAAAAVMSSFHR